MLVVLVDVSEQPRCIGEGLLFMLKQHYSAFADDFYIDFDSHCIVADVDPGIDCVEMGYLKGYCRGYLDSSGIDVEEQEKWAV